MKGLQGSRGFKSGGRHGGAVKVHRLRSQPFDVNAWVIDCGRDELLLVDATTGADFPEVERQLAALRVDPRRIRGVHCTHYHCDHCGGAARLRDLSGGCPVYLHASEADAVRQGDARATLGAFVGLPQPPCPVEGVKEGDVLRVGEREFHVLHVPGHTAGHTALYEPGSRSLFSGDVVFEMGSFGRVDFPTGDAAALKRTLERLAGMDLRAIYPGHMDPMLGEDAPEGVRASLLGLEAMMESGQI